MSCYRFPLHHKTKSGAHKNCTPKKSNRLRIHFGDQRLRTEKDKIRQRKWRRADWRWEYSRCEKQRRKSVRKNRAAENRGNKNATMTTTPAPQSVEKRSKRHAQTIRSENRFAAITTGRKAKAIRAKCGTGHKTRRPKGGPARTRRRSFTKRSNRNGLTATIEQMKKDEQNLMLQDLVSHHLVVGGVKLAGDLFAKNGHDGNNGHCDKRNQQAVFDKRLTFFFAKKMGKHGLSPRMKSNVMTSALRSGKKWARVERKVLIETFFK